MLSVLDQHWREHLYEMDYLQEGINLRAMGQQDPLAEWQREGFDMFEAMMGQIEDDFVRYVFHLQVVVDEEPRRELRNVSVQRAERSGAGRRARSRPRSRPSPRSAASRPMVDAGRAADGRPRRCRQMVAAAAGAGREDAGPQRAVLLRERQEVQALPRALTSRDGLLRRPG